MLVKRGVDDRLQRVSYQAAYGAAGDSRSNRGAGKTSTLNVFTLESGNDKHSDIGKAQAPAS